MIGTQVYNSQKKGLNMSVSGEAWTFETVEARLVAALIVARRVPDRERSWLHVKAFWPPIVRERCLGDYDIRGYLGTTEDIPPPRVPLPPREIDAMEEAEDWLSRFLEPEERALVLLALGWKASGRRPGWTKIGRLLGVKLSRTALARRYLTAIAAVACGLEGKGSAAVRLMVRRMLAAEAREKAGAGVASAARTGRRRRTETEFVYVD